MATVGQVIAKGNVQISMDGSGVYSEAKRIKSEMAAMRRVIKETEPASDVLARKQDLLAKALHSGAITADQYSQRLQSLKAKYDDLYKSTSEAERQAQRLKQIESQKVFDKQEAHSKMIKDAVLFYAKYYALSKGFSFAGESVSLAAGIERNRVAFQTLTGSMSGGAKIADDILSMSRSLGIQSSVASEAAKTMLQFGTATNTVIPTVRRIADVTGGDAERIKMMSLAFAQAAAAGRLMGQDLLQMVNAGFNPLAEISRRTGVELVTLKKEMENGGISIEMVSRAFETATSEGGMFYQMLEKQKGTITGQYNQLLADVEKVKTELGNGLVPVLKEAIALSRDLLSGGKDGGKPSFDYLTNLIALIRDFNTERKKGLSPAQAAASLVGGGKNMQQAWTDQYLRDHEDFLTKLTEQSNEKLASIDPEQMRLRKLAKEKSALETHKKEVEDITNKINEVTLGKNEAMRQSLIKSGLSELQAAEIKRLHDEYDALQDNASATKDLAKERKNLADELERMHKGAYDLVEGLGLDSPVRSLVKQINDLQEMLAYGVIDDETYMKARKQAAMKESVKRESTAQSAEYGSQEAYRLMIGMTDKQTQELQAQTILMEADRFIQEDIRESIKSIPAMRALR